MMMGGGSPRSIIGLPPLWSLCKSTSFPSFSPTNLINSSMTLSRTNTDSHTSSSSRIWSKRGQRWISASCWLYANWIAGCLCLIMWRLINPFVGNHGMALCTFKAVPSVTMKFFRNQESDQSIMETLYYKWHLPVTLSTMFWPNWVEFGNTAVWQRNI